jgi:predicted nucleic acid-binding protein
MPEPNCAPWASKPFRTPLIELIEVDSEVEATQFVALAARCLSIADAASIVAALGRNRALVTDDKRLKQ